jgi:hypothetical protein
MSWPRTHVEWYVEPGYEAAFRHGLRITFFAIAAGVLIGRCWDQFMALQRRCMESRGKASAFEIAIRTMQMRDRLHCPGPSGRSARLDAQRARPPCAMEPAPPRSRSITFLTKRQSSSFK